MTVYEGYLEGVGDDDIRYRIERVDTDMGDPPLWGAFKRGVDRWDATSISGSTPQDVLRQLDEVA